jgi:PEGA domain
MNMRRRLSSRTLMIAICTFAVHSAWALDAEELLQQGARLRAEYKDSEALVLFTRADAIKSTPTTRVQMALAEQALGLWALAEKHLVEALRSEKDPWIAKNILVLRSSLSTIREHLGSLELLGGEPGSEVRVDGVVLGTLPLAEALRLEPGRHELEVKHEGFRGIQRRVTIVEQGQARETLTMLPLDAPNDTHAALQTQRIVTMSDPGRPQRTVGYIFLGASGASAIFGGVSLLTRELISQSYNGNPLCGSPATEPQVCREQVGNRTTWMGVAIGSFIGAGMFLGVGTALLLTAPSSSAVSPKASLACGTIGSGIGLSCAGTF